MSRQQVSWLTLQRDDIMSKQFRHLSRLTLSALLIGFPLLAHAAEAPGALTFIVKDENTDRPLSKVQITLKERETSATQTLETDEQGRILVESLEPGLYFSGRYQKRLCFIKCAQCTGSDAQNYQNKFELKEHSIEVVEVGGDNLMFLHQGSSTYLDREALASAVGGGADPLLSLDGFPASHPPVNSPALVYVAVAHEIICYSLMTFPLIKQCTLMPLWVKRKMWVVGGVSLFSHRT